VVLNQTEGEIEVEVDCSRSENMVFSVEGGVIKKRVKKNDLVFMMHSQALPSADKFKRSAKCTWAPVQE
jgi:hypothetical protein